MMDSPDEDDASKTILGAAVKAHVPIDDDLIALAKEVERQKKQTLWYKFKQELLARVKMIVSAALAALTGLIVYFFEWVKECFSLLK